MGTLKMASLARVCLRASGAVRTSQAMTTATRSISVTASNWKDLTTNDPVEHATGLEKYELLAKKAGNDDPFFMKVSNRVKGTKDQPNIVDAMDSYRMIGCVCKEDDTNIKWMWIYEGQDKRCGCGHCSGLRNMKVLPRKPYP